MIASHCCSASKRPTSSRRSAATSSSPFITRKSSGRSSATRAPLPSTAATSSAASPTSTGSRRLKQPRSTNSREFNMAKFDLNDSGVVVIVGSGAGGGTLGNELAQKGVKVVILEAGSRIELQDFVNDE